MELSLINLVSLASVNSSVAAEGPQTFGEWALVIITCFFMLASATFSFIAALGIVRMPDLFTRMQAAAKTGTLGVGCALIALAFHFADIGVTTRAALVILFLFLTAPVAAHLIARAGYITGLPLWEGTVTDEMQEMYNLDTHELSSGEQGRKQSSGHSNSPRNSPQRH